MTTKSQKKSPRMPARKPPAPIVLKPFASQLHAKFASYCDAIFAKDVATFQTLHGDKRLLAMYEERAEGHVGALAIAAEAGWLEAVKVLLDAGADVDGGIAQNPQALPPMRMAALENEYDVCALLARRGADPFAGPTGGSAMAVAARQRNFAVFMLGVTQEAAQGALIVAASEGYPEGCRVALAAGASVNQPFRVEFALTCAVRSWDLGTAQLLISQGADPAAAADLPAVLQRLGGLSPGGKKSMAPIVLALLKAGFKPEPRVYRSFAKVCASADDLSLAHELVEIAGATKLESSMGRFQASQVRAFLASIHAKGIVQARFHAALERRRAA